MDYPLVVLLGSQVKKTSEGYILAPHTKLKALAAVIAYNEQIAEKFIISGGHNFFVRYDDANILSKADFRFESFARGQQEASEAQIIKDFIVERGVPEEAILMETTSATTQENAEILEIILKRTPFLPVIRKVALLTLGYHMKRAILVFEKSLSVDVAPLFAEDMLAFQKEKGIKKVCDHYASPKGGKQYDSDRLRYRMQRQISVGSIFLDSNP